MATPGTYISATGHAGLVLWLVLGWGFAADPLEFQVTEVSVISGEEFAALTQRGVPDPVVDAPAEPSAPEPEAEPAPPAVEDTPTPPPPPEPVTPPEEEAPPPPAPEPPAPVAEVEDAPPTAPAPPPQVADPTLELSPRPTPREAPRIAPTPVAPPPPDTDIAEAVTESATPEPAPEPEVVEEPVEDAAPEEATTEIVTEAEEPSRAVETSLRPAVRPNRPAPAPTSELDTEIAEAAPDQTDDAVAAALEAAIASTSEPATSAAAPLGQQLSGSETAAFYSAVSNQWRVDPGSEAAQVVVTVAFEIGQDRRILGDVRLVRATDGTPAAVEAAFQKARRALWAVSRSGGFPLPEDKFAVWQNVELTFDPSSMRLR